MVEYRKQITFILMVDGDNLPEELPAELIESLISNLNISDETNDMFSDSIQDNMPGDVVSFRFEASNGGKGKTDT